MSIDIIIAFGCGLIAGAVFGALAFALCAIQHPGDGEEKHDR